MFNKVKKSEARTELNLVMDYKTKLEPTRWRASMKKFDWKGLMSFHSTVQFYGNEDDEISEEPRTGEWRENISMIYLDHSCVNYLLQESLVICIILDAVMFRLRD